jgi:hypothetical protein
MARATHNPRSQVQSCPCYQGQWPDPNEDPAACLSSVNGFVNVRLTRASPPPPPLRPITWEPTSRGRRGKTRTQVYLHGAAQVNGWVAPAGWCGPLSRDRSLPVGADLPGQLYRAVPGHRQARAVPRSTWREAAEDGDGPRPGPASEATCPGVPRTSFWCHRHGRRRHLSAMPPAPGLSSSRPARFGG